MLCLKSNKIRQLLYLQIMPQCWTRHSTKCYSDWSCYPAELAIDHNRTTSAITEDATPRPWWRASMSSMTAQQVRWLFKYCWLCLTIWNKLVFSMGGWNEHLVDYYTIQICLTMINYNPLWGRVDQGLRDPWSFRWYCMPWHMVVRLSQCLCTRE